MNLRRAVLLLAVVAELAVALPANAREHTASSVDLALRAREARRDGRLYTAAWATARALEATPRSALFRTLPCALKPARPRPLPGLGAAQRP